MLSSTFFKRPSFDGKIVNYIVLWGWGNQDKEKNVGRCFAPWRWNQMWFLLFFITQNILNYLIGSKNKLLFQCRFIRSYLFCLFFSWGESNTRWNRHAVGEWFAVVFDHIFSEWVSGSSLAVPAKKMINRIHILGFGLELPSACSRGSCEGILS